LIEGMMTRRRGSGSGEYEGDKTLYSIAFG
jgi:hypothetical protein